MPTQFAADLSYLVVPALLLVLLFPVLRASGATLRRFCSTTQINARVIVSALALGILLRLAWWSHVVAGVSLGLYHDTNPAAVQGLSLSFQCPPIHILATGFVVMGVLVPIVEEIIHRGFVQTFLHRFGPAFAICGSAAAFTAFHPPGTWLFVFLAGLVFGTQFWITRSLWSSLITHASVNALVQLDWRCLEGRWNPPASDMPYTGAAVVGLVLLISCAGLIAAILVRMYRIEYTEARIRPGAIQLQGVRDPLDDV